jgi:hypothetical protein
MFHIENVVCHLLEAKMYVPVTKLHYKTQLSVQTQEQTLCSFQLGDLEKHAHAHTCVRTHAHTHTRDLFITFQVTIPIPQP